MYAHEILEEIKTFKKLIAKKERVNLSTQDHKDLLNVKSVLSGFEKIRSAQKFHIGDGNNFLEKNIGETKTEMFKGSNGDIRMPYPLCYFDYTLRHDDGINKSAMVVTEIMKNFILVDFLKKGENDIWWPAQYRFGIEFVKDEYRSEEHIMIINVQKKDVQPGDAEKMFSVYDRDLTILNMFLLLLSCKNITKIKNYPSKKINCKRRKKNKQEIFTYYTLIIKPTGKQQKSIPKNLWQNRIHFCRGHFKTYIKPNLLFGKYAGRYWWQPTVKGQNKKGIVLKDYELDAEQYT